MLAAESDAPSACAPASPRATDPDPRWIACWRNLGAQLYRSRPRPPATATSARPPAASLGINRTTLAWHGDPPPEPPSNTSACATPFRITPHTDFFFTGANRGPTLEALIYAITHDEGIVKVMARSAAARPCSAGCCSNAAAVETLYLANPSLSRGRNPRHAIADELGPDSELPAVPARTVDARAYRISLSGHYAAGKRLCLMIDEAHAMPARIAGGDPPALNLESNRHKLLHPRSASPSSTNASPKDMRQLNGPYHPQFADRSQAISAPTSCSACAPPVIAA